MSGSIFEVASDSTLVTTRLCSRTLLPQFYYSSVFPSPPEDAFCIVSQR